MLLPHAHIKDGTFESYLALTARFKGPRVISRRKAAAAAAAGALRMKPNRGTPTLPSLFFSLSLSLCLISLPSLSSLSLMFTKETLCVEDAEEGGGSEEIVVGGLKGRTGSKIISISEINL